MLPESSQSKEQSFSKSILKWTKKMQSMATVCGSTEQLHNIEPTESFEAMAEDKPERQTRKRVPSSGYHNSSTTMKVSKASSNDSSEHDHHTFATATTATASFSENEDAYDTDLSKRGERRMQPYSTHSFPAGKNTFTVDTRYSMTRVVGSGAYGVVISSHDSKADMDVAIKMVPKAFNDEVDAKRILREIKLLKHFKHDNIVGIVDMMPPNTRYLEDYHDIYMVTDLMETDLHRIIYSKQKLSIEHVQYFAYQLLRGLKYIHSADVIHRDLKPSNLLVNSNCDLKICDFGLARGIHPANGEDASGTMLLTEYVVTRWYRAPEIMLACHEYSKPVDVWSVGCIFAELIQRKPYFPGDDYIDQLTIISKKLGKISEADLAFVTSDKAKRFMRKLPNDPPAPLSSQFPGTPPNALDMMRKMLSIHPRKRITVEDALAHPFFAQLHSTDDEPTAEAPFDFSFEEEKLVRIRLQELIWQEAGHFRPSCLPVAPRRDGQSSHSRRQI